MAVFDSEFGMVNASDGGGEGSGRNGSWGGAGGGNGDGGASPPELDPRDPMTFSRFCVYLAVHRLDFPVTNYEEAVTEGRRDAGFDGIVVSVDGQALSSVEQAVERLEEMLLETQGGEELPSVRVLMVQVKREFVTPMREVDFLGTCARRFLKERNFLNLGPNAQVRHWWEIYDALRGVYERRGLTFRPMLDIVFAYAGYWREDVGPEMSREMAERDLRSVLHHSGVSYRMWGVDELVEAIEMARKAISGVLRGAKVVAIPEGHARGWLGCAPAGAIMDLIPERDDRPDDRAFVDNVRAFLGDSGRRAERSNPGAVALAKTLEEKQNSELLLRHNGITIVAREAEQEADGSLFLREFQVVNGAQTTFVLHRFKNALEGAWVPVKIVVTEDEAVKNGVILGVNTQSPVNEYDMLSRQPTVRALQQSFDAVGWQRPDKLWMQRRRREWIPREGYEAERYVTPKQLLEAFAAAIMEVPHKLHHEPGLFVQQVPEKIFCGEHDPAVYRAMGWLVVTGRRWARRHDYRWLDDKENRRGKAYPARHQFIYALWCLVDPMPDDSDLSRSRGGGKVEKRFGSVCERLAGDEGEALGERAGLIVDESVEGRVLNLMEVRRVGFTERVRELAGR